MTDNLKVLCISITKCIIDFLYISFFIEFTRISKFPVIELPPTSSLLLRVDHVLLSSQPWIWIPPNPPIAFAPIGMASGRAPYDWENFCFRLKKDKAVNESFRLKRRVSYSVKRYVRVCRAEFILYTRLRSMDHLW